jgi:hypothetical protein
LDSGNIWTPSHEANELHKVLTTNEPQFTQQENGNTGLSKKGIATFENFPLLYATFIFNSSLAFQGLKILSY